MITLNSVIDYDQYERDNPPAPAQANSIAIGNENLGVGGGRRRGLQLHESSSSILRKQATQEQPERERDLEVSELPKSFALVSERFMALKKKFRSSEAFSRRRLDEIGVSLGNSRRLSTLKEVNKDKPIYTLTEVCKRKSRMIL